RGPEGPRRAGRAASARRARGPEGPRGAVRAGRSVRARRTNRREAALPAEPRTAVAGRADGVPGPLVHRVAKVLVRALTGLGPDRERDNPQASKRETLHEHRREGGRSV